MTRKTLIDKLAEKGELFEDLSSENCCAGSVDPSPFKLCDGIDADPDLAIQELAKWLYRHSSMFDYDNAHLVDCIKEANQIIEEANK